MRTQWMIEVEDLAKRYRVGAASSSHSTLREMLSSLPQKLWKKEQKDFYWALKDVSFQIPQGQVIGLIGRNGAGKSTLLKMLTRITEPTYGEIRLYSRVGALLEVGTGFHPELTGRENIFVNGAILGMKQQEIRQKFDQIVAFSGVEAFLDLPVKRYSSGMAVRLAFAIAAHLDPEILIVDEVLAVGDAAFQKKCLQRISEVATEGRTVVYVSHQMESIQHLCHRILWLEQGRLKGDGPPQEIVSAYFRFLSSQDTAASLQRKHDPDVRSATLQECFVQDGEGHRAHGVATGSPCSFAVRYETHLPVLRHVTLHITLLDGLRRPVTTLIGTHEQIDEATKQDFYQGTLRCCVPALPFVPGVYFINASLQIGDHVVDQVENLHSFEVWPDPSRTEEGTIPFQGVVLLNHTWDAT